MSAKLLGGETSLDGFCKIRPVQNIEDLPDAKPPAALVIEADDGERRSYFAWRILIEVEFCEVRKGPVPIVSNAKQVRD